MSTKSVGRGFGQSPKAAEAIRAAAEQAATKLVEELKPLPEPPTYATAEDLVFRSGEGGTPGTSLRGAITYPPDTFPKVLSALEMCISIAEDELAGTDGYSIVAEAEAELAALRDEDSSDGWLDVDGRIYHRATCGVHAVHGPPGELCPICSTYEIMSAIRHGVLKPRMKDEDGGGS